MSFILLVVALLVLFLATHPGSRETTLRIGCYAFLLGALECLVHLQVIAAVFFLSLASLCWEAAEKASRRRGR